ncbi:MAG TPA: hypothetical protein VF082_12800 [Jiangellaceae bacterium]
MSRKESVEQKAIRYISERRVLIRRVEGRDIDAEVRGTVTYYIRKRRGGWRCDCIAGTHRRRCAHLEAVRTVTEQGEP